MTQKGKQLLYLQTGQQQADTAHALLWYALPTCCLVLLCYAAVGEDNVVRVEFIYEPEQQGTPTSLELQRHTPQEARVRQRAWLS